MALYQVDTVSGIPELVTFANGYWDGWDKDTEMAEPISPEWTGLITAHSSGGRTSDFRSVACDCCAVLGIELVQGS